MIKRGLGKGLEALIPTRETKGGILEIELEKIHRNRFQPRQGSDSAKIMELADSIKSAGVLEPVIVRSMDDGYELISGERRWMAARQAGLRTIPAILRDVSDREALVIALIENLQREDLNPIEEARGYTRLMEEFGLTQQEVSLRVGKERSTVANLLRLLNLPKEVQVWVMSGELTEGHARALLSLSTPQEQIRIGEKVKKDKLSVRETESFVKKILSPKLKLRVMETAKKEATIKHIEEAMQKILGTKVRIHAIGDRGKIEIDFYSKVDMERILEILKVKL